MIEEYNSKLKYDLYQIDEEINGTVQRKLPNGTVKNQKKYVEIDKIVAILKKLTRQYYIDNLAETLLKYEYIK